MKTNCLKKMPWVNKPERKPKSTYHNNTNMRELRRKAYNDTKWRKVRQTYLQNHPVCEQCLKEGKVYAGTLEDPLQVHHKQSPFTTGAINYELLLDSNNLETLCSYHHSLHHQEEKGYQDPAKIIAILDELLLKDNWEEDDDK